MSEIVTRNAAFAMAQCIAAAWKPLDDVATDWNAVISAAADLDPDAIEAELMAGSPYDRNELNALRIFRMQTKLRIALRCKAGRPQYAGHKCGTCGSRPASPVNISWDSQCLYCEEADYLVPEVRRWGYREAHTFVAFDTTAGAWGIAFQNSGDREYTAAVVVSGYASFEEALIAERAPRRFQQLYNRVCGAGFEADWSTILPIGELFSSNLPFGPDQWRSFCEANFRKVQIEESEPFANTVSSVCSDYFSRRH